MPVPSLVLPVSRCCLRLDWVARANATKCLVKSVPKVVGFAGFLGATLGIYEWSGGVAGWGREQALQIKGELTELEDGQRQGFWDVVHRRPLSQTLDELGDLVKPFK